MPPVGGAGATAEPGQPTPVTAGASGSSPDARLPGRELPVAARVAWAWRAFYDASIDPALMVFLALIEEAPDRADVYYGAGRCLLARGEIEAAAARFAAAVERAPTDPDYRFYLGETAYLAEDFATAIRHWEATAALLEARPRGPLHRDHAWLLARAYLEVGNLEAGDRWFARALTLGGLGEDGRLRPPSPELEYSAAGRLPADRFQPVGPREVALPGAGLLFSTQGAIWRWSGGASVRERLTRPLEGWRDSHPALEPGGERLAFVSTDPGGRSYLMLQEPRGERRRLLETPIAPLRPAWSRDRALLAFVMPVEGSSQLRVHLLQLSSGDVRVSLWPDANTIDPHFGPANELLVSAEREGRYGLARTALGSTGGEWLEVTGRGARSGKQGGAEEGEEKVDPRTRQAEARLEAVRRRGVAKRPMVVGEPWSGEELARERTSTFPSAGAAAEPSGEGAGPAATAGSSVGAMASRRGVQAPPAEEPVRIQGRPSAVEQAFAPLTRKAEATSGTEGADGRANPGEGEGDLRQPVADRGTETGGIAYVQRRGGYRQVLAWSPDGRLEQLLSPAGKDCTAPDISPDGRAVLFVCLEKGISRLYLYERASGRVKPVFREPISVSGPAWIEGGVRRWAGTPSP